MPNFRLILSTKHQKMAMVLCHRTYECLFCGILPKKAYNSNPSGNWKNIHPFQLVVVDDLHPRHSSVINLTVAALWFCHLNTNTWLNLNFKSQGYKVLTNCRWERLLSPRVICTICCRIPWLAADKVPSGVFQPHTDRPFCPDYRRGFTNARAINKLSALLCKHL